MAPLTRRDYFKGVAGGLAAAHTAQGAAPRQGTPGKGLIQLSEIFGANDPKLKLAKQVGVNHAILNAHGVLAKIPRSQYLEALQRTKDEFATAGVKIVGVESHPVPAEKIKLGIDGRDEEIENYIAAVEALAKADIRILCYNFMAGLGWYRTKVDAPERGGALTSEFDNAIAVKEGLTKWGEIPEDRIWSAMEYFQKAVIPVADRVGVKMALHPDDPPLSPLRGIGRILTSAKNYRRVLNMVSSPMNGVTFCQANFVLMGEDIEALAREWAKKIFFVHFRDVTGTREKFRETFHDNGPTDMVRMLKVYNEIGFVGPMRPDHAPTIEGEANDRPGYAMGGKVFAFGYMKGVMRALNIAYA